MKNAVSGRTKTDLSALYDELEGKLRLFESLGRTQEKYGDFLTPLVESCLPEEILMAWERKRNTGTDAKGSRTLEHLMTFLRLEVQGEEMVQLAKSGLGTPIRKKDSPTERVKPTELMTASALASSVKSSAIETKLGWTVIGKVCSNDKNVMLTTSSLHVRNGSIKELWELDVLGITDPLLNENTKENFELTDFKNKMKILRNGRYEVKLPWKCNSENLPGNKELTWKRHLRMMNKLRNGKFFEDYKSVFRQWEDLNIIERVPEVELNIECHYLPHRPVIKLDSATTKIRPVFDASAREKGKPSLNDCLYKGVNLIEQIPDILDRFRIYPVGIVADIEKAFLMLSVAPKDRDYLRFFSPCNEKQLVYRHCRVVFGVSSSPYLLNASIMHLLENCNSEYKEVAQKLKSSFNVDNCVTGVFSADEIEIFIEKTKLIMSEGCFNLRIFESNVASKSVDKHSDETLFWVSSGTWIMMF
ncbi:uncharacterized protein TNCV_633271 [Trichonephila clavipes]|nr:uncharacterized protein TNCV_633271 [Trichonephila clavipes]